MSAEFRILEKFPFGDKWSAIPVKFTTKEQAEKRMRILKRDYGPLDREYKLEERELGKWS